MLKFDDQPYCRFQWPVGPIDGIQNIDLTFGSFAEVEAKLKSMVPEIPDNDSPHGESVLLTHRCGQVLKVGVSPVGWAIMIIDPQYDRFGGQTIHSLVEYDENFEIGFNDPTYTDYSNTELHDDSYALKMIECWLDTGHFPLFFAPNQTYGFGQTS